MPSVPKACLLPLGASLPFVAILDYATHTNKVHPSLGNLFFKLSMAITFIDLFAMYWAHLSEKRGGHVVVSSAIMGVLCAALVPLGWASIGEVPRWYFTTVAAFGYGGMLLGALLCNTRAARVHCLEYSRRSVVSADEEASASDAGEAGVETEKSTSLIDTSE